MKKILFIGSEAVPFVSTGGLGDVLGSLPNSLFELGGYEVFVALPLYSSIADEYRSKMKLECEFTVSLAWRNQYCGVYSANINNIKYYFIENEYYFKRARIYGEYDDGERYAFFCKAVLDMLTHIGFCPHILHANDWHTALCIIYLKRIYNNFAFYKNIKTVFTIHNIEYQGIFDFSILGDVFSLKSKDLKYVEYNGKINLLKGAITCCDILTTVSPKYAQEIKDKYYAAGLEHITNLEAAKTVGITNGIDTKYYNPYADSEIIENYSPGNMKGKSKCKKELQKHLNLAQNEDTPIIAMISRLAFHKGFDLVKYALNELLSYDLQFVLLGTGERSLEEYFKSIYEQYPDKSAIILSYDKALAKIIYAGADMFLMPSKSEPCGLAQMIASRYGTVPIVRRTGGLYDTISPFNVQTGEGNGITFETYNAHDMLDAIKRALELYNEKAVWHKLVKNVINTDFSWNASALKYSELYDKL